MPGVAGERAALVPAWGWAVGVVVVVVLVGVVGVMVMNQILKMIMAFFVVWERRVFQKGFFWNMFCR